MLTAAILIAVPGLLVALAVLGARRDISREEALGSGTLGVALADHFSAAEASADAGGGDFGGGDGG